MDHMATSRVGIRYVSLMLVRITVQQWYSQSYYVRPTLVRTARPDRADDVSG